MQRRVHRDDFEALLELVEERVGMRGRERKEIEDESRVCRGRGMGRADREGARKTRTSAATNGSKSEWEMQWPSSATNQVWQERESECLAMSDQEILRSQHI